MGYIYCITNLINKKQYIGKTVYSVTKRFQEHCKEFKRKRCEKRPLYDAFNKYGIENFTVEQLIECDNEELDFYEILYISKLNTYHNGYNATKGGDGKCLFDCKQIIECYQHENTLKNTAQKIGCCVDTVRNILQAYNINYSFPKEEQYKNGINYGCINSKKSITQYNLQKEEVQQFDSIADAAHWLVDNGYAKTYNGGVRQKISMCIQGKMKTAYKFIWK